MDKFLNFEGKSDTFSDKNHDFLDNLNREDAIPLVKRTDNTSRVSKQALSNVIEPFPGFEVMDWSKEFDWNHKKLEKYGNSYQLYIQALRIVSALVVEYEETKDIVYLEKAQEIIESWFKYQDDSPKSEMIWYDHPTANRAQNIVHFLYHAKSNLSIDKNIYYNILTKHAKIMSNPRKYNHNNHGLMMDRTLMILGKVLNNEHYFSIGYNRAIHTFWYSFSAKGNHLENSPSYHGMVLNMYIELEKYLNTFDKSFGETINNYIEIAKNYYGIIATPSNQLPKLGDSSHGVAMKKSYKNLFDYELGLAVLQYESPKPLQIHFVAGYSSRTHKHRDDLSFSLNYDNEDIFTDPGRYNYSKNPIRAYMTSPEAHSTILFENDSYKISKENRFTREIDLIGFYDTKAFTIVKGKNSAFNFSEAERTLILLKKHPIMLILDKARSERDKHLYQMFNFSHDVKLSTVDDKETILRTPKGKNIRLIQNQHCKVSHLKGSSEDPIQAVNTKSFGVAIESNQLKYENEINENGFTFETMIILEEDLDVSYEREDNNILIRVNDEIYNISI